jgi:hypothetical protein
MTKAYVETTIITDALLKPLSESQAAALAALKRYEVTLLPVYAIKEWKAGPLSYFAYLHNKLVATKSLAKTFEAVSLVYQQQYRMRTSLEALAAATRLGEKDGPKTGKPYDDETLADRYRLKIKELIFRAWKQRRRITTTTVQDLACYVESAPTITDQGVIDLSPKYCERDRECCLSTELKKNSASLELLRKSIPDNSKRKEDVRRRQALRHLYRTPERPFRREQCRDLGDAFFAFFAPQDAVILTTNAKDHRPLAEALGKRVETP